MNIVTLVLFLLALALAAAISRIAADVRKIRLRFDRIDRPNSAGIATSVTAFVPPPERTPMKRAAR